MEEEPEGDVSESLSTSGEDVVKYVDDEVDDDADAVDREVDEEETDAARAEPMESL